MYFASDNAGIAHPEVMAAVNDANQGYALGYGLDNLTQDTVAQIRAIFEAPEALVYLVPTGTAANALALACLAQPYETIFCAPMAHIQEDECGAPEFYSGAKLSLVGNTDKIQPDDFTTEIERGLARGFQGVKPGALSLSQVTEFGQIYSVDEIKALSDIAHAHQLGVHLDGARFANAMVALDVSPAEMSWKAGVDAVSFGATKNGCFGVEAVILFDPAKAVEFEARRKRGGHLMSKHRYLAAQMQGYLANDLWTRSAARSNATCARLVKELRAIDEVEFDSEPQANVIFCNISADAHQRLVDAGAMYSVIGEADQRVSIRLVCDWALKDAHIDQFLKILRDLA